jgi:excisionase family DNA binding protein
MREDDTAKRFYRPSEVAQLLGVSAAHVYRLCERGELRHTRMGRRVLIPAEIVKGLLAGNRGGVQ